MEFIDRVLTCSDCAIDFVFTAGEQLFFFDRQFKNDPKRCKLCKARRSGIGKTAEGVPATVLPLSRTETRTECSACGVDTTVPFKPTQGRPVFCRSCFQLKRVPSAVAKAAALESPAFAIEQAMTSSMPGCRAGDANEMTGVTEDAVRLLVAEAGAYKGSSPD